MLYRDAMKIFSTRLEIIEVNGGVAKDEAQITPAFLFLVISST